MLKRRRKLSKDLQIRKKLLPLHKISGISAKQSSELVVLRSICIIFANVNENGSAHRDSDTRVRQNFLWRAVSLRRFATQCVTINNS